MRRWGLGALLGAWLAIAPGAAADQLPFTIWARASTRTDSARHVAPIPAGFVGASMDYCALADYTGTAANPILVRLLLELAPAQPVIRVGGDGPDASCSGDQPWPMAAVSDEIAALARATDARLILGLNLIAHQPQLARREVTVLLNAIDQGRPYPLLEAFEVGNEPDLYPIYGPVVAPLQTEPYFLRYLADLENWARIVRRTARDADVEIAGPSLGRSGLPWITGPNRDNLDVLERGPLRPGLITFHLYPLLSQIPCPAPACPTIANLLLDSSSHGLALQLVPFLPRLRPGHYLRVDELNSVTGGGVSQVSDTFASALWALDTMFELARAGAIGVNMHTFPSGFYSLYSNPRPNRWIVHPEYYGLLLFERAAPAAARLLQVSPVDLPAAGGPNVKVWATRDPVGVIRVVLINKDTLGHTVLLQGPAVGDPASVSVERLQAPPTPQLSWCAPAYVPTGLCAQAGIRLGGASFGPAVAGPPAGDSTATGLLPATRALVCAATQGCARLGATISVTMPAGSAALLTELPEPPRRERAAPPAMHGSR